MTNLKEPVQVHQVIRFSHPSAYILGKTASFLPFYQTLTLVAWQLLPLENSYETSVAMANSPS